MKKQQPISTDSDWNFPLLEQYEAAISKAAAAHGLDTFPNQIELISSEQMMDAYASVGLPIYYHHWSFGKRFIHTEQAYRRGQMGLAYELVINSSPCIAYLQEENTLTMQALVIAHACFGHNSFFKGNYLFKTWTDPESIVDYLVFARDYISKCEARYGEEEVESLLDACHALMNYGVDRYQRPHPISMAEEKARQTQREESLQQQVNDLWRTIPTKDQPEENLGEEPYPAEPQENLLYFFEKDAPLLAPWQREIIRIVRKMGQYLYPQRQTQVMNEGWACFWHYQLLHDLYEQGLVSDGFMIEFLQSHTNVVFQPAFDSPMFSGINPYALGFAMMCDIRQICESPDDEDRYWFPDLVDTPWRESLHFAMANFKDESFIQQYLSPRLIRKMRLFGVMDDASKNYLEVTSIHNDQGYQHIRDALAGMYNLGNNEPNIQVVNANIRGDRTLTLVHRMFNNRPLDADSGIDVMRYIQRLWGFDVNMESRQDDKLIQTLQWPPPVEAKPELNMAAVAIVI